VGGADLGKMKVPNQNQVEKKIKVQSEKMPSSTVAPGIVKEERGLR